LMLDIVNQRAIYAQTRGQYNKTFYGHNLRILV
jgi:hypothetical protein